MKKALIIIFSLILFLNSNAQSSTEKDSLKAEIFFQEGVKYRASGEFDEAIQSFDSAKSYFMAAQDTGLYFITKTDISWCYILTGQFDEALALCDSALDELQSLSFHLEEIFYRQKGIIYSNKSDFEASIENFIKAKSLIAEKYGTEHNRYARALGDLSVSYHRMGQYDKALDYRMEALAIQKKNGASLNTRIVANLNLGALYYEIGDYKKSLDYGLIALDLSLNNPTEVKSTTADLYENIGNCYKANGQYEKAIEYYQKAKSIRQEIFGEMHHKLGNSYQNLGGCYIQLGRKEDMLSAYKKSYEIRLQSLGESHHRTIEALKYVGIGYLENDELEKAEEYLTKGLNQEIEKFGDKHIEICLTLNNLGHLNRKSGNYLKAIEYDQKAAEMYESLYGSSGTKLSNIYESLARTYLEMDDYSNALKVLNKGMVANGMTLAEDPYSPPYATEFSRFRSVMESLMRKIYILEEADFKIDASQLIVQHVDSVSKIIERIKGDFSNKSDLFSLIGMYHDFIEKGIQHTYASYTKTGDEELLFKALKYIESSKDNLLTQKLYRMNARSFAGIPDSLLIQEKMILSKIEEVNNQLTSNDSLKLVFSKEAFDLERELDQLAAIFKKDYPSYYKLNYGEGEISTNQFKEYLSKSNDLTISYFIGENALYSIQFFDDQSAFLKADIDSTFTSNVTSFRNSISDVNDDSYVSLSKELYQILLHNNISGDEDSYVVIIPDGILSTVPFELLQNKDEEYFFERNNISYSSSIKYLISMANKSVKNSKYVGFAPKFNELLATADPVRSELSNIPGAITEINSINSILDGKSYLNENASETNFRRIADQYGMIHLATHAIIDDSNPDASRLIFSLKEDSLNDGYLHAYEIYNLELNASLITLSACNTGFGEVRKGEGVMSLSRAFAYAGVPSTVVSLWPASDKSTPELMKFFYQNLKDGQTKDVALNNARKQYLATATGKARHPFYWGGFVMIGENSPISQDRNTLFWIVPILILLVFIRTIYNRKRK